MTENEAIERIKSGICNEIGTAKYCHDNCMHGVENCAYSMAIQALEEIQQIKEIISNFPLDCGSPVEDIKEIYRQLRGFLQIGAIEEFKALKEKSVAKKPSQVSKAMDKDKFVGLIGRCPHCGSIVAEDNFVCEDCFQVLDWSE